MTEYLKTFRGLHMEVLVASAVLVSALWAKPGFAFSAEPGQMWTREIPCCFFLDDLQKGNYANYFVVELNEQGTHAAEMKLTTPPYPTSAVDQRTGRIVDVPGVPRIVGFDTKTGHYSKPADAQGYGLLMTRGINWEHMPPDWRSAPRVFVMALLKGRYRLEVIGIRNGTYSLNFYPTGWSQQALAGHNAFATPAAEIKAGEVQVYEFSADFDRSGQGKIDLHGVGLRNVNARRPEAHAEAKALRQ